MKSTLTIYSDGSKAWKLPNGFFHREDGPSVESINGDKWWYQNGKLHREDGPAVEHLNGKYWYLNNERHRENGPAIEYANGYKAWYYHDQRIDCSSTEEFIKLIKLKSFW